MRIIAGKYKGKKLISPTTEDIRPTLDRVKESIFNVLQFKLNKANVLDLFSGSGAMGIEAVSRESDVIFNDKGAEAVFLIRENSKKIGFTPIIYSLDYKLLIDNFAGENKKFDIIFIDPPYNSEAGEMAIKDILSKKILKESGVIVYEHSFDKNKEFLEKLQNCTIKSKKYGKVKVDFIYNN